MANAVNPHVIKAKSCYCGTRIELRDYVSHHLPARWYDADTNHAHTCPPRTSGGA